MYWMNHFSNLRDSATKRARSTAGDKTHKHSITHQIRNRFKAHDQFDIVSQLGSKRIQLSTMYNPSPNPRLRWHTIHLSRTLDRIDPRYPLTSKQFSLGLILARPLWIVQNTRLNDHCTRERLSSPEQRGSAVGAEVRSDLLAAVGLLGDLLGLACIYD